MPKPEIFLESIPVRCRVYGLSVCQSTAIADEQCDGTRGGTNADYWEMQIVLTGDRPFHVQVTVEWLGSAAIALLMLQPSLAVDFYIKPVGAGHSIDLGTVEQPTAASQQVYAPCLMLESPDQQGIHPGFYHLHATVRVGAAEGPALLWDVIGGVRLEVFEPPSDESAADNPHRAVLEADSDHGNGRNGGRSPTSPSVNSSARQASKKSRRRR